MKHFTKPLYAMLFFLLFGAAAQAQPARRVTQNVDNYKAATLSPATKTGGEWEKLGTGKFREDMLTTVYLVNPVEYEVQVEESKTTPGLYRVVSPYKYYPLAPATFEGDTYLEIDASIPDKVYLKQYETGINWGNGTVVVNSIAYDMLEKEGSIDNAYNDGYCGKLEEDIITFPKSSLLIYVEDLTMGLWRYANNSGMFRLVLPGAPDVDISFAVKGLVEKDGQNHIAVDCTVGSSCEKVKVAMVAGEQTDNMADDVANGTIASQEITASGEVLFPYGSDGIYTMVAIPYVDGKRYRTTYNTVELSYLHEGWNVLGKAIYTEGFFSDLEPVLSLDMEEDDVMEVEVQESTEKPGLFRLVDPYGPDGGYVYSTETNYDTSRKYYMEIDASDPDRVILKHTDNGCGLDVGVGLMYFWCNAERYIVDRGYTEAQVEEMGLYGKRDGNVITFPNDALCIRIPMGNPGWYWANHTGKFRVELPEGSKIDNAMSAGNGNTATEYYNLSGIKMSKGRLEPGVYIKRQGAKSEKVVIR